MQNIDVQKNILDMLEINPTCFQREICDRLYFNNKTLVSSEQVRRIVEKLEKDGKVKINPRGKNNQKIKMKFVSREDCWKKDKINNTKLKKVEAYQDIIRHSNRIGDFLEDEVAEIISNWGFYKIDKKKKSHNGVSIYPDEIDVYCHEEAGGNLALQIKNRKQPMGLNDVLKLIELQWKTMVLWGKPVTCGVVASFINNEAKQFATTACIPWVETQKVLIPMDVWNDYKKYKELTSANYYMFYDENVDEPQLWLAGEIYKDIIQRKYLKSKRVDDVPPEWAKIIKNIKTPEEALSYREFLMAALIKIAKDQHGYDLIDKYKKR